MRAIRWPVAIAAALLLSGGSIQAVHDGLTAAAACLLMLGAVLVGAWLVMESRDR